MYYGQVRGGSDRVGVSINADHKDGRGDNSLGRDETSVYGKVDIKLGR